jgi:hypothetical protein
LLPRAQPLPTDDHGNGATAAEDGFEDVGPGFTRYEIPTIEEGLESAISQQDRQRFDGRAVAPLIAEENVVTGLWI